MILLEQIIFETEAMNSFYTVVCEKVGSKIYEMFEILKLTIYFQSDSKSF